MTLDDFRADLEAEIKSDALRGGNGTTATFAEKITTMMRDAEYLNGDYQGAFFKGVHPRKRSNLRVDGYLQDETDNSLVLFAVHYAAAQENMTKTLAESNFKMLEEFVNAVTTTDLYEKFDESTSVAELAEILRTNKDARVNFILLTNAKRSATVRDLKKFFVHKNEVDCQIWDIERIFDMFKAQDRGRVKIDFTEYGDGIPCLRAAKVGGKCESFLCVMPGKILADIYERYGSRLLEGNVRSFLSTKRAVNKKIRATILNNPEMFFAFNNGIAATAKQIELKSSDGGMRIISATDFQIINGGQTTALLLYTRIKDKVSPEKIFVQMKLTQIGEMEASEQDALIEEIARSSNSQNKVNDADFFSTHPFHVEMEKISRRMFAPSKKGLSFSTQWFYERASGQYVQEQMKMTARQKKDFQQKNPKAQVISKTDLAKYRMSWLEFPHIVSKGAQTNFAQFAAEIGAAWTKNSTQFNELYFKETVALAIIFHAVENLISRQDWYKRTKSYRANIVTYSLAMFHHALKKKFPRLELNLQAVWELQDLPKDFEEIFEKITFAVNEFITGERPITNVTQWCKQELCWSRMKDAVRVDLPENFSRRMIDRAEARDEEISAENDQRISFEVDAQRKILSFSGATWQKIYSDACNKNLATDAERSALKTAMKIPTGKPPQPFQCEKLLQLLERLEENGLTYKPDNEYAE